MMHASQNTLLILLIAHVQTPSRSTAYFLGSPEEGVCVRECVCVVPPYRPSHPNGAGARTCIHLLLRPLLPLIVSHTHQTQAQEDFHRLQTKSQLRLADP